MCDKKGAMTVFLMWAISLFGLLMLPFTSTYARDLPQEIFGKPAKLNIIFLVGNSMSLKRPVGHTILNVDRAVDKTEDNTNDLAYKHIQRGISNFISKIDDPDNVNIAFLTWGSETCRWSATDDLWNTTFADFQVDCKPAEYRPNHRTQETSSSLSGSQYLRTNGYMSAITAIPQGEVDYVNCNGNICQTKIVSAPQQNVAYRWVPLAQEGETDHNTTIQNALSGIDGTGGFLNIFKPMKFVQNYLTAINKTQNDCDKTIIIVIADEMFYPWSWEFWTKYNTFYGYAYDHSESPPENNAYKIVRNFAKEKKSSNTWALKSNSIKTYAVPFISMLNNELQTLNPVSHENGGYSVTYQLNLSCDDDVLEAFPNGHDSSWADAYQPVANPTENAFRMLANCGGTRAPQRALNDTTLTKMLYEIYKNEQINESLLVPMVTTSPTVLPKALSDNSDIILTSEFTVPAIGSWKGKLTARRLGSDGNVSTNVLWELGDKLRAGYSYSRRIWSASTYLGQNANDVLNNFITTTPDTKYDLFGFNELGISATGTGIIAKITKSLIDYVRGIDAFDEQLKKSLTNQKTWKLGDIMHNKPILVSNPIVDTKSLYYKYFAQNDAKYETATTIFVNAKQNRKKTIYVGSNDGLVHAVDPDTGVERWAFFPPPLFSKLQSISTANLDPLQSTLSFEEFIANIPYTNISMAIYGVDGLFTAQDFYIDGEWHTYLAITFGLGSKGFSVIDVTNPDEPYHVLSVEHQNSGDNLKEAKIVMWKGSNGTRSIFFYDKQTDTYPPYSSLGYTTSAPIFSYYYVNGKLQPVLILGAGVSDYSNNPGDSTFVISLDPTLLGNRVLHNQTALKAATSYNPNIRNVRAPVELIPTDASVGMKNKYGFKMFVPTEDGLISLFDHSASVPSGLPLNPPRKKIISSGGKLATYNTQTRQQLTPPNERRVQQAISVSDIVSSVKNSDEKNREINLIYGTSVPNSTNNIIVSIQDTEDNFTDGLNLSIPTDYAPAYLIDASNRTSQDSCLDNSKTYNGWIIYPNSISIVKQDSSTYSLTGAGVSGKIQSVNGITSIPLIIPSLKTENGVTSSVCGVTPKSAVLFRDTACGYPTSSAWYSSVPIGGVTLYNGGAYASVSGAPKNSSSADAGGAIQTGNIFYKKVSGGGGGGSSTPNTLVTPAIKSIIHVH